MVSSAPCPRGCLEIVARPVADYASSTACRGREEDFLGCRAKSESDGRDACMVSEDGTTLYSVSGTESGQLYEYGFSECSISQSEILVSVDSCE